MKIVKLAFFSVVILFLVITAMSLLLPSTIIISRAVDINRPADSIRPLVGDVKNWPGWMENFTNATVSTTTSGSGAHIIANKVKVTILTADSSQVKANWQAGNSRSLQGQFNFVRSESDEITTVQWQFTQHLKWYPWEKFASIVSDKALGPQMEKSLDNLKSLAERSP